MCHDLLDMEGNKHVIEVTPFFFHSRVLCRLTFACFSIYPGHKVYIWHIGSQQNWWASGEKGDSAWRSWSSVAWASTHTYSRCIYNTVTYKPSFPRLIIFLFAFVNRRASVCMRKWPTLPQRTKPHKWDQSQCKVFYLYLPKIHIFFPRCMMCNIGLTWRREGSELSTRDLQKIVQALPQYGEQVDKLSTHVEVCFFSTTKKKISNRGK